jgi:putative ABC transport system permease protein
MLRSFLLITFRILWRNKVTTFVNIFSLSVGLTAFIFIMLFVWHETNYDKFNTNFDRIYRLEADGWGKLPPVFGRHVNERIPEVENIALLSMGSKAMLGWQEDSNPENLKWIEGEYFMADSTTFDVFTFSFIQGKPKEALKLPMSIVLTRSMSQKLFGEDNPMGKPVIFWERPFMITGIIEDIHASHIEIDFLVSHTSFEKLFPQRNIHQTGRNSWAWSATYLLMTGPIDKKQAEDKINKVLSEINDGKLVDTKFERFHIRPLKEIYFDGEVKKLSYGLNGNKKMVMVLIAIGIFLLVLAAINYINLTTARSTIRSKEIAVKRVTGSTAGMLRWQLIGESVIISLVSLVVAMTIVQLFLPKFNQLTSVTIQMDQFNHPFNWALLLTGGIVVGILAGMYPAFYLTSVQPVSLIKGGRVKGSGGSIFRSGLMTFQFALSIIMIVSILVNFRQLHYLRTADLGFKKEHIINVSTPSDIPNEFALRETFKIKLLQHTGIEGVSFSYGTPGTLIADSPTMEINGAPITLKALLVDEDYLTVMGMTVLKGRGFSKENPGDQTQPGSPDHVAGILLNETAVQQYGMDDPIGQIIYFDWDSKRRAQKVVGIVKDFHIRSFHDKIEPLMFTWINIIGNTANIKIASSDLPATLKTIEAEFKNVWGQVPLTYSFLDETFNRQYQRDEQLAKVIGYFTVLAVIIACLGLFALSSFMVSRRIKEIGVRKTMGASVSNIYSMLSWDFLKWILVAIGVACPLAWYLMRLWLDTFAYHITLGVDVFVMAALVAIMIALLTVTGQSLKVARSNPIDSLRYE